MSATFTDADAEVFEAVNVGTDEPMIDLLTSHGQSLSFYTRDACAIIALIAEAGKGGVPE